MTAAEYVSGIRDWADWVEKNADAFDDIDLNGDSIRMLLYCSTPEEFADKVRRVGRAEKSAGGDYFNVTRKFGPIEVHIYTSRGAVCRKVVKGTKVVPAHTIPAREAIEVPERVEEIVEWECEPSILALADGRAS